MMEMSRSFHYCWTWVIPALLLRLPSLPAAGRGDSALQVEVSDSIHERDKKTTQDGVTRLRVEDLLFEVAHKFLVNRRVERAVMRIRSLEPYKRIPNTGTTSC